MPSIKDVAKRAGVSISTVSHVLNGTKYVSEELTRRVEIAVKELGYVANPIARTMKSKNSKTIGVITADICGLFYPYILKGIYEIANEKGYHVIICDTHDVHKQEVALKAEKNQVERLISMRVDGIIFTSAVPRYLAQSYLQDIIKLVNKHKYTPLISIERDFSMFGIDSVCFDSYSNAKTATRHLIECGCKHIGHISGPIFTDIALDRIKGYKDVLMESGFTVDEKKMIANGDYTHQSGYKAMKELLKNMPDIDGVFIANDQMAVGALKALSEANINVPEDIKIIGHDNVFIASILEPAISTIHVRKRHIGLEAAKLLFKRIEQGENQTEPIKIPMESKLVVRKSTVLDAPEDWILSDW